MSRETNSLLLRYGINKFWPSSISLPRLLYKNVVYNTLFNFVLSNYFLHALKIQYSFPIINIYVFYFKHDRFTFLYKYLNLKKALKTIEDRKLYGLKLQKGFIQPRKLNSFCFFYNLLILSSKKLLACLVYTRFITGFNAFLFHKKLLIQKNLFLNRVGIIKSTFFWNYKLNFINQLLKLKILGLYCHLIIYLYTSTKVKVNLKSIMEKWDGILHFPFHFKYNSIQIQKVFIIFISFLFVKSSILNNYINIIIKKTKNKKHIKNLIVFFSSLKLIFDKQFVPLLGLKFKIAGRLDGKLRKASYGYKLGSMRLLSLALNLDYSCDILYTQYGSFSLKLWLGNKISSLA